MLVVAADVGGIAHDEIVACAFGDGLPPGAFAEFDFGAQRLGVAAGNGESLFGDVRGGHARPGALLGERHGNAAAAVPMSRISGFSGATIRACSMRTSVSGRGMRTLWSTVK